MSMGAYEAIDRLCGAISMLADLVREQAAIIELADIPDETKGLFEKKRCEADDALDVVEYQLRERRRKQ